MEQILLTPSPVVPRAPHAGVPAGASPCGESRDWPDIGLAQSLAQSIVDQMHFGILVVGPQGRVWLINEAALRECSRHRMLTIEDGRLIIPKRDHDARLTQALAGARGGRWSMVQLEHETHRLMLAFIPLRGNTPGAVDDPVLVMFGPDTPCEALAIELYARSCALTPAEARLLRGLKEGLSPREIAGRHDVALSTVRSQIGSVRSKTGARSIVELVRTLSCLPPIMPTAFGA